MQVQTTQALNKLRKLDKRVRIVRGGTSAGKTICILLILIDYAIKNEGKEISVVSESIPHLRRGAFKDFCQLLKGLNTVSFGAKTIVEMQDMIDDYIDRRSDHLKFKAQYGKAMDEFMRK